MAEAVATRRYTRQAARAAKRALPKLSARTTRCIELSEDAARANDDNHVGTEHIVLGLLSGAPEIAALLGTMGIARATFEAQLFEEPGPSPEGHIPLTPRSHQVLGFALEEASHRWAPLIEPIHLLLGVIDESRHWASLRSDGPHHFAQAANGIGLTLDDVRKRAVATLK